MLVAILKNHYIVVVDYKLVSQRIFYNGTIELEALKILKDLQLLNKKLFKSNVIMCKIMRYDFIKAFEVIERIV